MSDNRKAGEEVRKLIEESEHWIRIMLALDNGLKPALLSILHNNNNDKLYRGMSKDPKQLYKDIEKLKKTKPKDFKVLKKEQMDKVILPKDGSSKTDTKKWDITIIYFFLRHGTTLPEPEGGWKDPKPETTDALKKKVYYCFMVKELRNKMHHNPRTFTDDEFNQEWENILTIAKYLPCDKKLIKLIKKFKTNTLDPKQTEVFCKIWEESIDKIERRLSVLEKSKSIRKKVFLVAVVFVILAVIIHWRYKSPVKECNKPVLDAIKNLKSVYKREIGNQKFISLTDSHPPIKRFAVNLAIVNSDEYKLFLSPSERYYHINKKLKQHGTTTLKNLLSYSNSSIILLQGTGGVGKTFMLNTAALHWSENLIWQDVDLVLFFTFRELNLLSVTSFEELLKLKYKFLFEQITFEKLFSISRKVVIMFDGLDEFVYIEDLEKLADGEVTTKNIASAVFEVLNPNSRLIPQRQIVITARPIASQKLKSKAKEYTKWSQIQTYDVLGFSLKQVEEFIITFNKNNPRAANKIKKILNKSNNLMLMSRIPAYLRGLCEIYHNEYSGDLAYAKTTTEIFIGQLTIFFKKHYRDKQKNIKVNNLIDVFKNERVRKSMKFISELARTMLLNETILMDISEVNKNISLNEIDVSGLLSIINTPVGEKLEFNHLLMQEFLTALYYIEREQKTVLELYKIPQLEGCIHLYAGLQGALLPNTNSPKAIVTFLQNLNMASKVPKQLAVNFVIEQKKETLLADTLYEYQNMLNNTVIAMSNLTLSLIGRRYYSSHYHLLSYFLQNYADKFVNFHLAIWFDEISDQFDTKYKTIIKHICKVTELYVPRTKLHPEKWIPFLKTLYNCRLNRGTLQTLSHLVLNNVDVQNNMDDILIDIISTYHHVQLNNFLTETFMRKLNQAVEAKALNNIKKLDVVIDTLDIMQCKQLAKIVLSFKNVSINHTLEYGLLINEIECLKDQINITINTHTTSEVMLRSLSIQNWHLEVHIQENHITQTWEKIVEDYKTNNETTDTVFQQLFNCCTTFPGILYPFSIFLAFLIRGKHKTKWIMVIWVIFIAIIVLFGKYYSYKEYPMPVVSNKMKFILSDN